MAVRAVGSSFGHDARVGVHFSILPVPWQSGHTQVRKAPRSLKVCLGFPGGPEREHGKVAASLNTVTVISQCRALVNHPFAILTIRAPLANTKQSVRAAPCREDGMAWIANPIRSNPTDTPAHHITVRMMPPVSEPLPNYGQF
jgi:hypothetical protein